MGGKKSDLTKEEKATSTKVAKKVEEKKSVEKKETNGTWTHVTNITYNSNNNSGGIYSYLL